MHVSRKYLLVRWRFERENTATNEGVVPICVQNSLDFSSVQFQFRVLFQELSIDLRDIPTGNV